MWTPRRLVLLAAGIGFVAAAFLVYNRHLGWLDGLPALPQKYLARAQPDHQPIDPPQENRIDRLLRQAFGDKCPELDYIYKLGMQMQGVYLATDHYALEDGRVRVWPFSLAILGKVNPRTGFPEIQTVHCDSALITFDRPIESTSDIGRGTIVAAKFTADPATLSTDSRQGSIYVKHNHGTPTTADDLVARLPGPVYFRNNAAQEPEKPQLWSLAAPDGRIIEITDNQAKPPHSIKAETLEVFLDPEALKSEKSPGRTKDSRGGGSVRRIAMHNVQMRLTVDGKSDFLRSSNETTGSPRSSNEPKSVLSIRTMGDFQFDLRENRAEFEIDRRRPAPQYVQVVSTKTAGTDELRCEKLALDFRRKATGNPSQSSMEIELARATGKDVFLESPAEKLRARGHELIFHAVRRQAVLKGSPLVAIKDGNRIEAPELMLHRPDPRVPRPDSGQPLLLGEAGGPGIAYLNSVTVSRPATIRWNNSLVIERDGERDRITLDGNATFDDEQNQQWLRGDQIKVWLAKGSIDALSRSADAASAPSHAKPEKMHVIGRVQARTPELSIDRTDLIVVWFQDVAGVPAGAPKPLLPAPMASSLPAAAGAMPPASQTLQQKSTKKPLQLSAETIETFVIRDGQRLDLDQVKCRKRVHVHQDGEKTDDHGLDLTGQTLDLTHTVDGEVLKVIGATGALAKIEVKEMTLLGSQIICDQRDNHLEVDGSGNIHLLVSTDIGGNALDRPAEVIIYWNGRMELSGNRVQFDGGVRAEQETLHVKGLDKSREMNRLTCPKMDVFLDRTVSLSQMHRQQLAQSNPAHQSSDNPKVKRVVCHRGDGQNTFQSVTIDSQTTENGKLTQFHRIRVPEATFENDAGEMITAGPGEVRLFQLGEDLSLTKPQPDKPPTPDQVSKLTCIEFAGRMRGQNRTRVVTFAGPVRVAHSPTDDFNARIDPDKLPPGAFTLSCQKLEVTQVESRGAHSTKLVAEGKASVSAPDFSGLADVIKYDEAKQQQVIFDSKSPDNPAVLWHSKVKGQPKARVMAESITYLRQTNDARATRIVEISGTDR